VQVLDLQGNQMTGTIPADWAGMTALDSASLANNPGLCTPGATSPINPALYYGPCDPPSPPLPGISPDYPVSGGREEWLAWMQGGVRRRLKRRV